MWHVLVACWELFSFNICLAYTFGSYSPCDVIAGVVVCGHEVIELAQAMLTCCILNWFHMFAICHKKCQLVSNIRHDFVGAACREVPRKGRIRIW